MAYVYKIGLDWDLFIYLFCNNANASCLGAFCLVVDGAQLFLEIISYGMAVRVLQRNMSLSSMPPAHLQHLQVPYC